VCLAEVVDECTGVKFFLRLEGEEQMDPGNIQVLCPWLIQAIIKEDTITTWGNSIP